TEVEPFDDGADVTGHGSWTYKAIILLIAGAGIFVFLALTFSRSQPHRRSAEATAPLVEVIEAVPAAVPVVVRAMGGVQPSQSVRLMPQVSGRVVFVNPGLLPGGRVKKGELLVQIDPRDFELAIRANQAEVTQAQLAVDVQVGQRSAARRELQLVGGELAPTQQGLRLASRESHVENANAQLDAARSRLEQAELSLSRTMLRAPFDARVQERLVDVGQVVSPQSTLASLYSSNEAWAEAALPTEQLRWIDVPGLNAEQGSVVRVSQKLTNSVEIVRSGRVLGLLPSLTERGKLARLLIGITDPFAVPDDDGASSLPASNQTALPLLVGSFVHLEIQGRTLPDLIALPRGALREGGQIWIRDAAGLLAFRSVEVVWRDDETVYVRGGVQPQERIITSHLSSPIPGMHVALAPKTLALETAKAQAAGESPRIGVRETEAATARP
ncbi:MAG: efflux RND transporter periplasmic adaptor subunit, partial [Pseudomonadota bacterium]